MREHGLRNVPPIHVPLMLMTWAYSPPPAPSSTAACPSTRINQQHNFGNIGYWVRESCQRRGIATRAVRAIADYGFNKLKLTRLEIVAAVDSRASRDVAERAGAIFECIARIGCS